MINLLWIALCIAAVLLAGWGLHRLCIRLEEWGYIYYRQSSGGRGSGIGSVFLELDRLTRPSVEHVVEVQNTPVVDADETGDPPDHKRGPSRCTAQAGGESAE